MAVYVPRPGRVASGTTGTGRALRYQPTEFSQANILLLVLLSIAFRLRLTLSPQ